MRVAVIGGAIAGLSTAWSLTRSSIETTLVERGARANPLCASGDHHRNIRDVVSCAYTFISDEHFLIRRIGRSTIISACAGAGNKFGATVGRRVVKNMLDGDDPAVERWIEARD